MDSSELSLVVVGKDEKQIEKVLEGFLAKVCFQFFSFSSIERLRV